MTVLNRTLRGLIYIFLSASIFFHTSRNATAANSSDVQQSDYAAGLAFLAKEKFAAAEDSFIKAVETGEGRPYTTDFGRALIYLGLVQIELAKFPLAKANLQHALIVNSDGLHAFSQVAMGTLDLELANFDSARTRCELAADSTSSDSNAPMVSALAQLCLARVELETRIGLERTQSRLNDALRATNLNDHLLPLQVSRIHSARAEFSIQQGALSEAFSEMRATLQMCKKAVGEASLCAAESQTRIGALYVIFDHPARDTLHEVDLARLSALSAVGGDHPLVAQIQYIGGIVLLKQQDFSTVIGRQNLADAILQKAYPDGHPRLADVLKLRAAALYSMTQYPEADADLRKAIEIYSKFFGPNDARTKDAIAKWEEMKNKRGKTAKIP